MALEHTNKHTGFSRSRKLSCNVQLINFGTRIKAYFGRLKNCS